MDVLWALISARNLVRSSFCEICHLIFFETSRNAFPEPPLRKASSNTRTFFRKTSILFRHSSDARLAVAQSAFNSTVLSQVRESISTSSRARSRIHSSRMISWYSAEDPRLSSRVFTRSLMSRHTAMISPTEPNVIGMSYFSYIDKEGRSLDNRRTLEVEKQLRQLKPQPKEAISARRTLFQASADRAPHCPISLRVRQGHAQGDRSALSPAHGGYVLAQVRAASAQLRMGKGKSS